MTLTVYEDEAARRLGVAAQQRELSHRILVDVENLAGASQAESWSSFRQHRAREAVQHRLSQFTATHKGLSEGQTIRPMWSGFDALLRTFALGPPRFQGDGNVSAFIEAVEAVLRSPPHEVGRDPFEIRNGLVQHANLLNALYRDFAHVTEARRKSLNETLQRVEIGGLALTLALLALLGLRGFRPFERRITRANEQIRQQDAAAGLVLRVTAAANEAEHAVEALRVLVAEVCRFTGWHVGHVYLVDREGRLESSRIWYPEDAEGFRDFRTATERTGFLPGTGLPGRVAESGAPLWIEDVQADANFSRAESAKSAGFRSALAFPVVTDVGVAAVAEFFYQGTLPQDPDLLDLLHLIGTQVGRAVERERAAAEIQHGREFLRAVIENIHDGIIACDADGTLSFQNRAAREIRDIDDVPAAIEEWIAQRNLLRADGVTPVETDEFPLLRAWRGERVEAEELVVARDGRPGRTVTVHAQPILDPRGRNLGAVASMHDITDMKAAEKALRASRKRYRILYNKTPAMMHSIDADRRLVSVSDYWLQHMGYEREEVIDRPLADFLTEESRRYHIEEVMPAMLESGWRRHVPYQMVKKDGAVIDVLVSAVAEHDEDGQFLRTLSVILDVTEQKQLEHRLQHAQRMEAVGQLTGGIAHDFNNLLTVVIGNLQLLERRSDGDERAAKNMKMALTAARRGGDLTQQLLAFSRRQVLDLSVADIRSCFHEVRPMLERTLGENIAIKAVFPDALWKTRIDVRQFENAVINLAVNARDAMPDGGALTVHAENVRLDEDYAAARDEVTPGDYVMFAVSDTGVGMPSEILDKVFDPFFTTKDVGKGTGLGLSMIFGYVKQTGGHVEIYSEPNHGTTVKLYFPRHMAGEENDDEPEQKQMASLRPPGGRTGTVLLVEDEELVRQTLAMVLEQEGYRIFEVENGDAAAAILKEQRDIDLVVTDVVMPGEMHGWDVIDLARSIRADIPVIVTSGYPRGAAALRWLEKKGCTFVAKPYRNEELLKAIDDAMQAYRGGE